MVSRFDAIMQQSGRPVLEEHLGEVGRVQVRTKGGPWKTVGAIVGAERIGTTDDATGRVKTWLRDVTISTDPDATNGGIAIAQVEGLVKIDGATYSIDEITSRTASQATLRLGRFAKLEENRERLRRNRTGRS